MKLPDHYAALGVARDADAEHIKKAYRKLARQNHPDVSKAAGAEARFKEAALAYATLKNPDKRAAYDQEVQQAADFARYGQGQNAQRQQYRQNPQNGQHDFDGLDLDSLLAAMARSQSAGRPGSYADPHPEPYPENGRDYDTKVRISLLQAHLGTTVSLDLSDDGVSRTLEVSVPAGMKDDQKLRLRGKGSKGRNGGADGDIYLHITLEPHPIFRADQHDLTFDLRLAPWEAALGAAIEVPTLDTPVLLTVAPGTGSGRKLRLRGQGMNKGRGAEPGERGDLYAVVQISVPSVLSPREHELFEALATESTFKPRAIKESTT